VAHASHRKRVRYFFGFHPTQDGGWPRCGYDRRHPNNRNQKKKRTFASIFWGEQDFHPTSVLSGKSAVGFFGWPCFAPWNKAEKVGGPDFWFGVGTGCGPPSSGSLSKKMGTSTTPIGRRNLVNHGVNDTCGFDRGHTPPGFCSWTTWENPGQLEPEPGNRGRKRCRRSRRGPANTTGVL